MYNVMPGILGFWKQAILSVQKELHSKLVSQL